MYTAYRTMWASSSTSGRSAGNKRTTTTTHSRSEEPKKIFSRPSISWHGDGLDGVRAQRRPSHSRSRGSVDRNVIFVLLDEGKKDATRMNDRPTVLSRSRPEIPTRATSTTTMSTAFVNVWVCDGKNKRWEEKWLLMVISTAAKIISRSF